MSLSTELSMNAAIRPALAGLLGGSYLWWRTDYSLFDFKNAGIIAGSVWLADMTANVALPHAKAFSSNKTVRSIEHMVTAPALSGLIYGQAYRYFYPESNPPMSKLFLLAAGSDVAADKLSTPLKHMLQADLPDEF